MKFKIYSEETGCELGIANIDVKTWQETEPYSAGLLDESDAAKIGLSEDDEIIIKRIYGINDEDYNDIYNHTIGKLCENESDYDQFFKSETDLMCIEEGTEEEIKQAAEKAFENWKNPKLSTSQIDDFDQWFDSLSESDKEEALKLQWND